MQSKLQELGELFGPCSIGLLTSSRATLETQFLTKRWAASLGSDQLCFEAHPRRDLAARVAASQQLDHTASLEDVRNCDLAVLIGADPLSEAPMLALALRQAVRRGARIVVVDPRPVALPVAFERHTVSADKLSQLLRGLTRPQQSDFPSSMEELGGSLANALLAAKSPLLIGGADLLGPQGTQALQHAAESCSQPERPCRTMFLLAGPNSFGGALLSADGPCFNSLLEGMEQGRIKALLCFEADPLADFPDRKRSRAALARLDMLAVFDCAATATVQESDLFFPTTTVEESAGSLINNEGRMQTFEQVFFAGTPLAESASGSHPPRFFTRDIPGSEPQSAWGILGALMGRSPDLGVLRREIEKNDHRFTGLYQLEANGEGRRIAAPRQQPVSLQSNAASSIGSDQLQLLVTETLYGSELLSSLSPCLQELTPPPFVMLHPQDATRFKLEEGKKVLLGTPLGDLTLTLRIEADMVPGVAIVPRLRGTVLEPLVPGTESLPCRIEKA